MNEPPVLKYSDLIAALTRAAAERGPIRNGIALSLPVPVTNETPPQISCVNLLAFIYRVYEGEENAENPDITGPYASVQFQLDGAVVEWKALAAPEAVSRIGRRFTGLAAEIAPAERSAFIQTYYELLTDDRGPVRERWPRLDPVIVQDLRTLFYALVEAPLLPLYKQYASPFLKLIGVA